MLFAFSSFLGENFGETASPVDITIGGQKVLAKQHNGWDQTNTLEHRGPIRADLFELHPTRNAGW